MAEFTKRRFLQASAGLGLTAVPYLSLTGLANARDIAFHSDPFQLGIASGAPTSDSIILWTRLINKNGLPPQDIPVSWQLSRKPDMSDVIVSGEAPAKAGFAHSVHVDVKGLAPGKPYWYQFYVAGIASPIGRTKTLPAGKDIQHCRFASVSCQNYTHGYYTAYQGIIDDDPDFVLHLGDYIYEKSFGGAVRRFPSTSPPQTLNDYRNWHAFHKLDPQLQAAHAALPFIMTLDNHDATEDRRHDLHALRAAAYQAWYEHMPVRNFWRRDSAAINLASRVVVGDLLRLHILDTRQFRDNQNICSGSASLEQGFGNYRMPCPERLNDARQILGAAQMETLTSSLTKAKTLWTSLASTVPFAPYQFYSGEEERFYIGAWDGYPAARQRLTQALTTAKPENFVVVSGDVHSSWAVDLRQKASDADTAYGTELIGTSISSNWPEPLARPMRDSLSFNPHVRFQDLSNRGYLMHDITRKKWTTTFKTVADVSQPKSQISTAKNGTILSGKPGIADLF